ncbi:MAG TPA: dihydrofolate reductase family protein [Candidatus Saccharimonadales bacterium]|nr:dihydrofolate reductase family protein [Candidatus Saccharimonadales bacterium]
MPPAFEVLSAAAGGEPSAAEIAYGGPLRFPASPRPYVIANFVASIDGVASLGLTDGTDSTTLSGSSRADRYLMGLLRASVDAVVIGAGNLRATPGHQWTPAAVAGDDVDSLDAYRVERTGTAEPPLLVVVSASGDLPAHVALDGPAASVAVVTAAAGAGKVRAAHPLVTVVEVDAQNGISGAGVVAAVTSLVGPGLLLCEGGPSLFGRLMADHTVQELFLTIAPRLAGRDHDQPRPGVIDAWAAPPAALRTATIESVRRSDDHLFLRYRLEA